jgi:hypothetical protein
MLDFLYLRWIPDLPVFSSKVLVPAGPASKHFPEDFDRPGSAQRREELAR